MVVKRTLTSAQDYVVASPVSNRWGWELLGRSTKAPD